MQKVFWTQGAKVSEKSFAPPKPHFGNFPFSVNFPGPQLPKSKAPFLTLRVAAPSGAPRQAPLESNPAIQLIPLKESSRSPKAGHPKAGRSDFRNQRFETDTGKTRKMRKVSLTPENKGLRRFRRTKTRKTRKMRKMRTRKRGKCGKCG